MCAGEASKLGCDVVPFSAQGARSLSESLPFACALPRYPLLRCLILGPTGNFGSPNGGERIVFWSVEDSRIGNAYLHTPV
jgi:hypothetical protein